MKRTNKAHNQWNGDDVKSASQAAKERMEDERRLCDIWHGVDLKEKQAFRLKLYETWFRDAEVFVNMDNLEILEPSRVTVK